MKKIRLDSKKLQLKKETIASLTREQMSRAMGGVHDTDRCDTRGCTDPDINTITRDTHSCPPVFSAGTCETKCGISGNPACDSQNSDLICF
jgi:hypothetical protein